MKESELCTNVVLIASDVWANDVVVFYSFCHTCRDVMAGDCTENLETKIEAKTDSRQEMVVSFCVCYIASSLSRGVSCA